MKKLVSIFLSLTMLFSLTTVLASPTTADAVSKRTKAVRAYRKYLKKNAFLERFALVYLDKNKIPELITVSGGYAYIATYKGGKVRDVGVAVNTVYTGGQFKYYKKTGIFRSGYYSSGTVYKGYRKLSGKTTKSKLLSYGGKYYMVTKGRAKKVSKLVYKLRALKITKFKKVKSAKFYWNNYYTRKHNCK